MPIWFEVIALMLVAYGLGLTFGWALWGRAPIQINQEGETE